jgi:hypothetical protein
VIDLLMEALKLDSGEPRTNGLEALAGSWTEEELRDFDAATLPFEQVDDELWR